MFRMTAIVGLACARSAISQPPRLTQVARPLLALRAICLAGPASGEDSKRLPLTVFFTPAAASQAARIVSVQREWGRKNCPHYFASAMWLSPLAQVYVETLRSVDPTSFDRQMKAGKDDLAAVLKDWATDPPTDASRKKYDFCVEVWTTFLSIEADASKAYWASGWNPKGVRNPN